MLVLIVCKKSTPVVTKIVTQEEVVTSLATNVNEVAYQQLATSSDQLYTEILTFCANPSDSGLSNCKQLWKVTRSIWESSEGFLYGPVEYLNIDPQIDTWPVDYLELDSLLQSSITFDQTTMNSLENALKGFHPMEYLLFGKNGAKKASEFSQREKDYLTALALHVKNLTASLINSWNGNTPNNFFAYFTNPSASNPYFKTQLDVYLTIVQSMIDICDEVANEKIKNPFLAKDPSLEESPFSVNSLIDFTNNIISVQNVFQGKFTSENLGLEDFVNNKNLSLSKTINSKINSAINSLTVINGSFSSAILEQPVQIQNAMNAINDLRDALDSQLVPFIKSTVK